MAKIEGLVWQLSQARLDHTEAVEFLKHGVCTREDVEVASWAIRSSRNEVRRLVLAIRRERARACYTGN